MISLILLATFVTTLALPLIEQIEKRADKIQLYGVPKPLSGRDKLHIRLGNIGVSQSSQSGLIKYTSILSNEECLLKRFDKFEEICETIQRSKCKPGNFWIAKRIFYPTLSEAVGSGYAGCAAFDSFHQTRKSFDQDILDLFTYHT